MQPWEDPQLEEVRSEHIRFAREHLEGDALQRDRDGEFSHERWKECADFGILGKCMQKEFGGEGSPASHAVAAFDGLGYACRDSGFLYAMCSQIFGVQMALQLCASDTIKNTYLPPLISGDRVSAHGFTEKTSGSDAFSMETKAVKTDGGFILTGTKSFITNAPAADLSLVFAKTSEGRSPFGLTALLVDMDWDGARHGEEFEKVGYRTVRMGEMIFEDVFVPEDHVVGTFGGGLRVLTESTGWERALLLATALGPMARAIHECVERGKTRTQFDKPIGAYQQISSKIADMILRHKISRQIIYDMAGRLGDGNSIQPYLEEAAIAKLYVSENYIQVEMDALQIFGVRGILMDYFIQQDLRDSLSSTIWAGTSETLRNTIAKFAGLPVS